MAGGLPSAINNRNLFSNYYLETVLPNLPEWGSTEHVDAFRVLKERYEAEAAFLPQLAEPQLEQRLFRPVFNLLGFVFEVQAHIESSGDYPDYALFADKNSLDEAHKARGTHAFYDRALVIGEVKRWNAPLDQFGRDRYNKRRNPSFQIWLYLHETKPKWGILSDGRRWRLYHKDRPLDVYYEVDLAKILQENDFEAFRYFFYFFREAGFVSRPDGTVLLEQVLQGSVDYAREVGENLKENVYRALRILAQGFFVRSENRLDSRNPEHIATVQQSVMRLLYRLLFVLHAEGKGLLSLTHELYRETYSLHKLKHEVAERKYRGEKILPIGTNYWNRLQTLFQLIDRGSEAFGISRDTFYVPAYNGGLFDPMRNQFLDEKAIGDSAVAEAINLLTRAPSNGGPLGFVDYSTLKISDLGSIYEGLLEYRIQAAEQRMIATGARLIWTPYDEYAQGRKKAVAFDRFAPDNRVEAGEIYVGTFQGERKLSGSYYTPDYVVDYIVRRTIGPVIQKKWNDAPRKDMSLRDATLSARVVDPAMGSGHFLLGAVDFLATKLLEAVQKDLEAGRMPEEQAAQYTPDEAKREVLSHCIYGVDLNELAVELAKVSLWLFTISREKPLSFLDHRLKRGNGLIGAWLKDLAYYPSELLEGVAKKAGTDRDQTRLETTPFLEYLRDVLAQINAIADNTREDIEAKKRLYEEMLQSEKYQRIKNLADVRTGLFFGPRPGTPEQAGRQYGNLTWAIMKGDARQWQEEVSSGWRREAVEIAARKSFFNWELEFPDVFRESGSGFDAVIGNPPYVRIQNLPKEDVPYFNLIFESATQNYDLYVLFVEQGLTLLSPDGLFGFILPNKIFQADYAEELRRLLTSPPRISHILDFGDNQVFPDATTYTCLLFLSKFSTELIDYVKIERLDSADISNAISSIESGQVRPVAIRPSDISPKRWEFAFGDIGGVFGKLRRIHPKLGDIADVFVGIQTSADPIYIVRIVRRSGPTCEVYSKATANLYEIEEGILRPVLKGADIGRYTFTENSLGLIFPYAVENGKAIPLSETQFRNSFSKAWEYLSNNKPALMARADVDPQSWWSYPYPKNLAAFTKPKILTQVLARRASMALDDKGGLFVVGGGNAGGYGISTKQGERISPQYLLALLNSRLLDAYLQSYSSRFRGGFFSYARRFLEPLPIVSPLFSTPEDIVARHFGRGKEISREFAADGGWEAWHRFVRHDLLDERQREDILHELISFVATEIAVAKRELQAEAAQFLSWIESVTESHIEDWKLKTSVYEYHEIEFQELMTAFRRNEAISRFHPHKHASDLRILRENFDSSVERIRPLRLRSQRLETLVDLLVYYLYGITLKDVAAIENCSVDEARSSYGWPSDNSEFG